MIPNCLMCCNSNGIVLGLYNLVPIFLVTLSSLRRLTFKLIRLSRPLKYIASTLNDNPHSSFSWLTSEYFLLKSYGKNFKTYKVEFHIITIILNYGKDKIQNKYDDFFSLNCQSIGIKTGNTNLIYLKLIVLPKNKITIHRTRNRHLESPKLKYSKHQEEILIFEYYN